MHFSLEPRRYTDTDVARLTAEVQQEYVVRYGGPDAATVDPAQFDPPHGLFLVGLLDGRPVAMGGWRRFDETPDDAEIKRMYVVPRARRRGLSRLVLTELEATAARAGVRQLLLNTGPEQPEAIALYESSGYLPTARFGHYACTEGALFYGKQLAAAIAAQENSVSRG